MAEEGSLFPLEFFIEETPKSLQASADSKQRWKSAVGTAARTRIIETNELGFIDDRPVAVTVYYFPPARMEGDIDNIVKPILDALIAVAYFNDQQVERVVAQKFEPGSDPTFAAPSATLLKALDVTPPVVYIRVDDDLSWRRVA